MTRFKELRRIERAIEHRDANDLAWARAYCENRIRSANVKRAADWWRRLLKQVTEPQADE